MRKVGEGTAPKQRLLRQVRGAGAVLLLAGWLAGCNAVSSDSTASEKLPVGDQKMAQNGGAESRASKESPAGSPGQAADSNAAKPAAGASLTGETAPETSEAFNRKIIYKANLVMQVDKYQEAQAKIHEAVKQSGGYILQFNENASTLEKSGTFVIKVPATGFQSLLALLEQIQPTMQKNLQGQDVTEEYVDLAARLKAKQVVESRLIAFMEKAAKTDELLAFSNELGKVQEEIERIKGRMRYLEQNVAMSTIELKLTQKTSSAEVIQARGQEPLGQRAAEALSGTLAVLGVLLQWLFVFMAGALPVILLLMLIGIPVWLLRKRRKEKLVDIRARLAGDPPPEARPFERSSLPEQAGENTEPPRDKTE
ncbi:DUF4349 domain-containing protein [Paenibacillus tyrfis]|uniref:DUF4349 domain-containing protein n=1 Tax=Paenibacillus tyrfis TaxID=1501230 RepID=UPI0020A105EE|nr:DUF4349 domain-containing protein [Paenibacillus tyrfis]MCP1309157.1 DUF4349 domain-containing protein [Paenibacillus tyrfis]